MQVTLTVGLIYVNFMCSNRSDLIAVMKCDRLGFDFIIIVAVSFTQIILK